MNGDVRVLGLGTLKMLKTQIGTQIPTPIHGQESKTSRLGTALKTGLPRYFTPNKEFYGQINLGNRHSLSHS